MKHKSILLSAILTSGSMAFAIAKDGPDGESKASELPGPAYSLVETSSTLYWEGSKPGGTHHGTIEMVKGSAITDGELIFGGSFEIDMNSIRNEDVTSENMREKLVKHLKSEDFFYTDKYPTASFEITDVKAHSGISQLITGDLTIRGITREISFHADITMDEKLIHARTEEIVLDRTLWEVNFKSKSVFAGLKDSFIKDEMIIKLDIHLETGID